MLASESLQQSSEFRAMEGQVKASSQTGEPRSVLEWMGAWAEAGLVGLWVAFVIVFRPHILFQRPRYLNYFQQSL